MAIGALSHAFEMYDHTSVGLVTVVTLIIMLVVKELGNSGGVRMKALSRNLNAPIVLLFLIFTVMVAISLADTFY